MSSSCLVNFTANVTQKVKGTSVIRRMPIISNYLASHFLHIHGGKKEVWYHCNAANFLRLINLPSQIIKQFIPWGIVQWSRTRVHHTGVNWVDWFGKLAQNIILVVRGWWAGGLFHISASFVHLFISSFPGNGHTHQEHFTFHSVLYLSSPEWTLLICHVNLV